MFRRYADFLPAFFLPFPILLPSLHNRQHSHYSVNRRTKVMRHMGKKFAFCRIGLPDLFQKLHNGLFLLLPRHHGFRNVLMVPIQAGSRFFKCFIRHTAAADIYSPQFWMVPRINHLGAPVFQHLPHSLLYHLHIIRLNIFKPVLVAFFRFNFIRHTQKNPHGTVCIHPGLAAFLHLNGPDAGSGSLQNIFQTLPCFQLVLFFLLHYSIDVPLGKNRTIFSRCPFYRRKMHLQILQPVCAFFYLIPDRKFLLFFKLRKHIFFFCDSAEPFLVHRNHIL